MTLERAQAFLGTLPASQRRNSELTRWFTALDNYATTRGHANGHAVRFYLPTTREIGYVLFGIGKLRQAADSVYVVQDVEGATTAMYPVAWHGPADEFGARVVLHPYGGNFAIPMGPKLSYHIRLRAIDK